eukprot:5794048-Pyramimonas_sp.AAC.1
MVVVVENRPITPPHPRPPCPKERAARGRLRLEGRAARASSAPQARAAEARAVARGGWPVIDASG